MPPLASRRDVLITRFSNSVYHRIDSLRQEKEFLMDSNAESAGSLTDGMILKQNDQICYAKDGFLPAIFVRHASNRDRPVRLVGKTPKSVTYYGCRGEYLILRELVFENGRAKKEWYESGGVISSLADFVERVESLENEVTFHLNTDELQKAIESGAVRYADILPRLKSWGSDVA